MLYGDKREDLRQHFFDVWQKHMTKRPLEPLQQTILTIILQHPEYQFIFAKPEHYLTQEFFADRGETNPFLHFSLHLTIIEQVNINQPHGIRKLYQQAIQVFLDPHKAEHCLMHGLALEMQVIQQQKQTFDTRAYLKHIKKSLKKGHWK